MAKCVPRFENSVQLKQALIDLMKTRGTVARDRLEREHDGVRGIIKSLHTSTEKGLIGLEDDLKCRSDIFGTNLIAIQSPQRFLGSLGFAFTDPVMLVLLTCAITSLFLGYYFPEVCEERATPRFAWMEGCGILGSVIASVLISAFSDFFLDKSFHKVQQRIRDERKCVVVRSGNTSEIRHKEVQVGDVCVIKCGSVIVADGVLIQSSDLLTDETSLSADPDATRVPKGSDDPLVFAGTHVTGGSGMFVVIAIGINTQISMASSEEGNEAEDTTIDQQSLQGKLNKASACLGLLGVILGVLVMLVIIIRFSIQTYHIDKQEYQPSHWVEYVKAIILGTVVIVIAEPEGFPLAVSISLSHCIQEMHAKGVLVRNVDAVETVGSVTTLCCSKTGVLTELNELTVHERVTECVISGRYHRGDPKSYRDDVTPGVLDELCTAVTLSSSYSVDVLPSGQQLGDRTECALLQFVLALGRYYPFTRQKHPENSFVKVFPFNPERKSMTTVVKDEGGFLIFSKGDAETVLRKCTAILKEDGSTKKFLPEDNVKLQGIIQQMEQKSQLKVMCIASRRVHYPTGTPGLDLRDENGVMSDLTLIALVGIESDSSEESAPGSRKLVTRGVLGGEKFVRGDTSFRELGQSMSPAFAEELCRGIALNTSYAADIQQEDTDGLPRQVGSSADCALLQLVLELGETYRHWRDEYTKESRIRQYSSFKSDKPQRQFKAAAIQMHDGTGFRVYCRGGAEFLLEICSLKALSSLGVSELSAADKDNYAIFIKQMQEEQLEVVALAYKSLYKEESGQEPDWDNEKEVLSAMTLLGFVAIGDTLRQKVPDAILCCREAGIKVHMVSGDTLPAAGSFGAKCGILVATAEWSYFGCDSKAFNKHLVDQASNTVIQDKFDNWWPDALRILSRASPADKSAFVLAVINSRNHEGRKEIVAVTASGVDDGPTLSAADVGIAMGVTGADVTKEAADLVLLSDDFATIVEAVKLGRNLYNSLLKFLQFQFTVTWVAIVVVFVGACFQRGSPLSATQLLWVNVIMDSLASFSLTRDTPSRELLTHKPYGRHKPLVSRCVLRNVIGHVFYQITVLFVLIFLGPDLLDMTDGYQTSTVCTPTQHSTMVFTTFVFMQLFNEINCRRVQDRNVFHGVLYGKASDVNCVFIAVWVLCVGIQIIIVNFFSDAFNVTSLDWDQWMWCLFLGFSELVWAQVIFTIPKVVIPRQVQCFSAGISSQNFICGCSKVRRQSRAVSRFSGTGSKRKRRSSNSVSPV